MKASCQTTDIVWMPVDIAELNDVLTQAMCTDYEKTAAPLNEYVRALACAALNYGRAAFHRLVIENCISTRS
jgi:hypothetical protein